MIWIYDRTQEHVDSVYNGSTNQYDLERGTLGIFTLTRWKDNIDEFDAMLRELGAPIEHPSLIDMSILGPDIIRVTNPDMPVKVVITNTDEDTDLESNDYYEFVTSASNPVYYYIKTMNIIIDEANVREKLQLNIPSSTDYLTWEQLNNIEFATQYACNTILNSVDSTKLVHSGKLISGGHII